MSYRDIPGWSSDIEPFYEWVASQLPKNGVFVEIGVFLGRSLACMGELRPDLELYAIDPLEDGIGQGYDGPGEYADIVKPHGGLEQTYLYMMRTHSNDVFNRVLFLQQCSGDVDPNDFPSSLDMVFIDGAHDYESVKKDIQKFQPLMRAGGILAGHDHQKNFPGVVQAVNELLPHRQIGTPGSAGWSSVWWVKT